ncbi:hypothetical protein [Paenibacillus campi]|uniref:hypothetical protein n=1 Tax=Paenibacillus campi TaxID=3106031 RepID=UPI002AFF5C6E|nr:hypothetical protein [Paenibacillus sp. SGZ-1014]
MNNADSTWIDITIQGIRLIAYMSLLISAIIGLFGGLAMLQENRRPLWYRTRTVLVYCGLMLTVLQGIVSVLNIAYYQGWSAALIPFTTYAGRLSNGFALIAFYTTIAYIVPTLLFSRNHTSWSPRFLSALLFPILGLLMLSGLLTRSYEGLLPLLLIYVFTGVCLVWLTLLRWLANDDTEHERHRSRFNFRSPDIRLTGRQPEEHKPHEEESRPLPR